VDRHGLPPPFPSVVTAEPLSGRDLVAFAAAVETSSVHGAADALGLTQSAVSKRIQSLEQRTGVALLTRSRTGVRPTEAGRMLYPAAKQALAALQRAAVVVADASEEARHALRLAASHTIGEFLLPAWLAAFRAAVPDARLHVQVDVVNSPGVLAELRAGAAEIGFVEGVDELAGFEARTLLRDELVVVVAPGHRWARRRTLRAAELAQEAYLSRERGSGSRAVAALALEAHGVELEPALETPSIQGLKRAVLSGGFTLISRVTVQAEVQAGALRALRLRDVDLTRRLLAVRRRSPSPAGPARRLWSWLRSRPGGDFLGSSIPLR
jgi:DNA-binding transcriptional LysR family regulator